MIALIVEDHFDSAYLAQAVVRWLGLEPHIVRDGEQALDWLSKSVPAVVVLDLHLPGVSGVDVLHHIRNQDYLRDVPVVVVTAFPSTAEEVRQMTDAVVTKPYQLPELEMALSKVLKNRRMMSHGTSQCF